MLKADEWRNAMKEHAGQEQITKAAKERAEMEARLQARIDTGLTKEAWLAATNAWVKNGSTPISGPHLVFCPEESQKATALKLLQSLGYATSVHNVPAAYGEPAYTEIHIFFKDWAR